MVQAEETKTFVDSALENAGGALDGIQKAKELFFGGESPSLWQGVKGFFGFSLAQLENNPHFTHKNDQIKATEIRKLLFSMDGVAEEHQNRFLEENLLGME